MGRLARFLSTRLDAPVEDLTGLKGTYDVEFSWVPDAAFEKVSPGAPTAAAAQSNPTDTATGNNIFTAIHDSLGLKLERRKLQVEMIVLDHLERIPTAN